MGFIAVNYSKLRIIENSSGKNDDVLPGHFLLKSSKTLPKSKFGVEPETGDEAMHFGGLGLNWPWPGSRSTSSYPSQWVHWVRGPKVGAEPTDIAR